MAKALRTAAFVVGAVALAATGVGLAGSAGLLSLSASAAATVGTIATVANVTAAALSIAASVAAPKGTVGGSATQFKIDKDAGIPVIIGRSPSAQRLIRHLAAVLAPPERWTHPPGVVFA